MVCDQALGRVWGYLDGELDRTTTAELERHLADCASCRGELDSARRLSESVKAQAARHRAPPHLSATITATLRARPSAPARRPIFGRARLALAASVIAAAVFAGFVAHEMISAGDDTRVQTVVDSYRRSATTGRWTDLASSDRATLADWARRNENGFAPPVVDLRAAGYALQGGRQEFVDGRPAVALVYRRDADFVDLLVLASGSDETTHARLRARHDVNVVDWREPGLEFWAVSRIDGEALRNFHKAVEGALRAR